jgi:methionyl-tRNA formyltransferase
MRVVVLTLSRRETASNCLPALAQHPGVEVALVVHARKQFISRSRRLRRDLRKIRQIGLGGAMVGYHMRSWYQGPDQEDLEAVAQRYGIPFASSPRTNADETVELFLRSGAELGLSLGSGLIYPKVFRVPKYGMVNVHAEVLPRFQGAASVVWAIHEGIAETGFTIHEVESGLDTGRILYQERLPIAFEPTLEETVRRNVAEISRRAPPALAEVVGNFQSHRARARVQEGGRTFTTPTLRQFLHIRRQFERMRREASTAS